MVSVELTPILVATVSLLIGSGGTAWWYHEKRIRRLEAGQSRQARSVYGDESNPLQDGLTGSVSELEEQIAKTKEGIRESEETIEQIESYLEEINGYREKYGDD